MEKWCKKAKQNKVNDLLGKEGQKGSFAMLPNFGTILVVGDEWDIVLNEPTFDSAGIC